MMLDPNYIGQQDRLEALEATVEAHRTRGRALPHMLFLGAAGRGKTRLAAAVAHATNKQMTVLHAPSVSDRNEVAAKIIEADGGILFIDEIHSLSRIITEDLYTVLDEGRINVLVPSTHTETRETYCIVRLQLPAAMRSEWHGMGYYDIPITVEDGLSHVEPYELTNGVTVIGATTDEALLTSAFLTRLSSLKVYLRAYTPVELGTIGVLHAEEQGYSLPENTALFLASRARGTPRRMLQLVDRSADFTTDTRIVYPDVAARACRALGVDDYGLEEPHRAILRALAEQPGGLSRTSLGQRLGLTPKNLMLYWGELLEQNLVKIGTRHEITEKGAEALEGWNA